MKPTFPNRPKHLSKAHLPQQLAEGVVLCDLNATRNCAQKMAEWLPENQVLALSGDLGSGKSTFVRFLGAALGIDQPIKSPTYNLYNIYEGRRQLVHCDAYRLQSADAMEDLLIEDFLKAPWLLCVEWPENVAAWIPPQALWLKFEIRSEGMHTLHKI